MTDCSKIKALDREAGLICQQITTRTKQEAQVFKAPVDVYQAAVGIALAEAKNNYDRLKQTPAGQKFELQSPFLNFLNQKTSLRLPFIFDDLELLKKIMASEGGLSNLNGLQFFVKNTLGVKFKPVIDDNPMSLDAVRKHEGNCLDFVNLYYGISFLTGHEVHPIDDIGSDGNGHHVLVEQAGHFLDPEDGLRQQKPPLNSIQQIEPLTLASLYHYNKAFGPDCEKLAGQKQARCQLPHLVQALKRAPNYFRVLYDWGRIQWKYSDNKKGLAAIKTAHQLNPDYTPPKQALSFLQNN